MANERRKAERLDSNLFVEFEMLPNRDQAGRGVVVDVSLSGLAVDTEADLEVDQVLECHIEMPLIIKARVVRQVKEGQMKRFGLRFADLGFFDKWLIRRLLKGRRHTKKV